MTAAPITVAFDATALLRPPTGVGMVVQALADGLARHPAVDLGVFAVSWRGRHRLAERLPPNVRVTTRPMAARPLRALWKRFDHPTVERWTGPVDVVHGPNYVVPPAARAVEVVAVHDLTVHHHPHMCTDDVLDHPQLLRRALARGAWVHTGAEAIAEEIRTLYPDVGERLRVIPYATIAAEVTGGCGSAGRALAGGARFVVAVGTIEPRKDHANLIRAFDRVAESDTTLRLVIAGERGWGGAAFDEALRSSAAADRIAVLGRIGDREKADLLAGALALVYPSVYEGFGIPPLEAMAAGLPVVATTAPAVAETVADAASLVPVGDPVALANAIESVIDDPAERARLVRAGRRRVQAFSWTSSVELTVGLYRDALEDRRARTRTF